MSNRAGESKRDGKMDNMTDPTDYADNLNTNQSSWKLHFNLAMSSGNHTKTVLPGCTSLHVYRSAMELRAFGCLLPAAEATRAASRKRKASSNKESQNQAQDFNADMRQVEEPQLQPFDCVILSRPADSEAQDFNADNFQTYRQRFKEGFRSQNTQFREDAAASAKNHTIARYRSPSLVKWEALVGSIKEERIQPDESIGEKTGRPRRITMK